MTLGDVEMFTIPLSTLIKHKTKILNDPDAVLIIPMLASLKVTSSFFGFGGVIVSNVYTELKKNEEALWMFLSIDEESVSSSSRLAFKTKDYKYIKELTI